MCVCVFEKALAMSTVIRNVSGHKREQEKLVKDNGTLFKKREKQSFLLFFFYLSFISRRSRLWRIGERGSTGLCKCFRLFVFFFI